MAYTLGEAAKACGMSKAGIAKALANNKLSATKDAFGRWQIDPAELHRVYPPKSSDVNGGSPTAYSSQTIEIERLKVTIEGLERLYRQVEGERDSLREQNTRLTALLTDQSQQVPRRKGWFGWSSR
jgi:hypothetical protein